MLGRTYLLAMVLTYFCVFQRLFAYTEDFSSATYDGNVPSGWALKWTGAAYATLTSTQPLAPSGEENESCLGVNFYNATKANLLYRTAKIDDALVCDTILAQLRIYVTPKDEKVDAFQIVVSTNEWASYETVGRPIAMEDDRGSAGWETYSRKLTLDGLARTSPNVYVGILLNPAGRSHDTGYVHSLELNTVAAATPTDICLKRDGAAVNDLAPGEDKVAVSVCVSPDPTDERLALEGVYGVVVRNGVVSTNKLTRVEGTDEYVGPVLVPALDAGETLRISAYSKYASTLPTAGALHDDEGYAYEEADSSVSYSVGKLGSVWINELSAERLEIGGTTNRVMSSGWTLVVSDGGHVACRAELGAAFDFTTNMINGVVGIDVRDLVWRGDTLPADRPVSVSLCNSQGIAEHTVEMLFSDRAVMGFTGYAPWPETGLCHDWTGTAMGGVFAWGALAETSFGSPNAGQGFNVPVSVTLTVNTTDGSGEEAVPISHATVVATVADFVNATTPGVTTNVTAVSEDGVATLRLDGWSPSTNDIRVVLSGTAFGWTCVEEKGVVLADGCPRTVPLAFVPTVAFDDFSEFAGYWSNLDKLKWEVASVNDDGEVRKVLRVNTYSVTSGKGILKCENYLSAHGRSMCSLAFDYRNTVDTYVPHDDFSVLISTNANFEGTVLSSPALSNKRTEYGNKEWYRYWAVFELPGEFSDAPELWIELLCVSQYRTHTYTYVDNLRIAFQDVALPTGLTRSIEVPVSGDMPAFALDVVPQTTTNGAVAEVSADLHLVVNGVTNIVPFAFADGTLTNALSRVDGEAAAVPMTLSAEALKTALGGPFLTGDAVTYFAAVHYNSANGDTDPAKVYETRYFPDNATTSNINETAYWIVEGPYGVSKDLSANTFTVTGDALSCIGAPTVTTEGVRFTLHGYAEAGISSLTVNLNGTDYTPFEGLDTNAQVRVTGAFELPTGLAANTDYTVTISAQDVNGQALAPATFSFTTLPEVTGATIEGVSTNEVKLTVSGAAAGYVVKPPDGWTPQGTATWTRQDGTPNAAFKATVYGTNRLGKASAEVDATPGHTHAAVATRAPVVEKGETTVTVRAPDGYTASKDVNPEGTEYAVCVTTSTGVTNVVDVWKTLEAWREQPETVAAPILDLKAVNTFSFITRNFDGFVTTNEAPVTASCSFPLTAGFDDGKAEQKMDGTVALSLTFSDPAGSDGATAEVEYRLGVDAWQKVCEPFAIAFENLAATRALVWDAWTAVGKAPGEYPYSLRTRVVSGDRASEWAEVSGTLDFAPPADLTVSGTPAPGAVTAERGYAFTLAARDTHAVSYSWTLDGVAGTGETVSGTAAQDGTHTLVVTATDALGNTGAAVTHTWTLDTTAPTAPALSGAPADGAFTNAKEVNLTAASEDATALTYHWTFNGKEMEGEGATLTATAQEGANTACVYATDAAGNTSPATTWRWTVDTIPPTQPVLSGTAGVLTNVKEVNLTAVSEDATALAYHWTFNGATHEGATLTTTAKEGENEACVYATDAAGNKSPTTTWRWTLDTIPPQNLSIAGTPANGEKTKETAVALTASATDAHALTYHWTFNGVDSTGSSLAGTAREGKNTARVFAEDAAGNRCDAVTYTWTVDTEAPKNLALDGTPANGAVTKEPAFSFAASAEDATTLTYHWTLKTAAGTIMRTATGEAFDGAIEEDGAYTVSVFAEDETGNESETASRTWTVDRVAPRVALASETPESFNAAKAPLEVTVTFSEAVTDFTANAVMVENGTVTEMEKLPAPEGEAEQEVYRVTIKPTEDGEVTCQIAAGVVADAAGNGNEVSEALTRTYDTTRPTVVLTSRMATCFNAEKLVVTATFSEAVTGFTADVVTVENGTVDAVEAVADDENAYTVTITPADEGKIVVEIGADQVADLAENKNAASEKLTRTYDATSPTQPALSGVPETPTKTKSFSLTATSEDVNAIIFHWTLNGVESTGSTLTGTAQEGANTASVYAEDAAGNRSETTTVNWTLDTTPPVLSLDGTPANGALTKENGVSLVARATDATEVTFHWTFNGVESSGAALTGTAREGANEVSVYAEDAAGNRSETMTRTWTLDTTPPTKPALTGVPKSLTNERAFSMAATSKDANVLTYHWTFNGATIVGETFATAAQEGVNTVSVYAEDAAGNVSQTTTCSWTLDTIAPQGLSIAGRPAAVTKENGVNLTASATDAHALTYHWTFNGVASEGATLTATAQEGVNTASVSATDAAGNRCDAVTYTWTVDTEKPKNLVLDGTPADGAVTNVTAFSFAASAEDATTLTYHWTLKSATDERTATSAAFDGAVEADGSYTVSVCAEDAAGNVSDPETWTWTVDTEKPTVTLTSLDDKENDLYNAHDIFMVQVAFSEPVTDFTAESVTVENGEVKEGGVVEVEDAENTYLVTVTPTADGVVSVQIAADAVTDRAGNGNEASDVRTRTYDITPPTVTRFVAQDAILDEKNNLLDVTVTFSEPVTNFTAESVTVVNCDVRAVREDGENTYLFTVVPIKNGTCSVQIADGAVVDAAGNGNVASAVETRIYDTEVPTKPVISGTPVNGATVGTRAFSLVADATDDASGVKVFRWYINGTRVQIIGKNTLTSEGRESLIHEGVNTVTVEVRDATPSHWSEMSEPYMWTYEPDATTGDVAFGGDVRIKVDAETGKTNSVSFAAVAFKPGATCTFTLAGFEASTQDITDLQMWLVVCETLGGTPWRVPVSETARFDAATGALTVTLPPEATLKKPDGEPYSSFFILGIDNKDTAE